MNRNRDADSTSESPAESTSDSPTGVFLSRILEERDIRRIKIVSDNARVASFPRRTYSAAPTVDRWDSTGRRNKTGTSSDSAGETIQQDAGRIDGRPPLPRSRSWGPLGLGDTDDVLIASPLEMRSHSEGEFAEEVNPPLPASAATSPLVFQEDIGRLRSTRTGNVSASNVERRKETSDSKTVSDSPTTAQQPPPPAPTSSSPTDASRSSPPRPSRRRRNNDPPRRTRKQPPKASSEGQPARSPLAKPTRSDSMEGQDSNIDNNQFVPNLSSFSSSSSSTSSAPAVPASAAAASASVRMAAASASVGMAEATSGGGKLEDNKAVTNRQTSLVRFKGTTISSNRQAMGPKSPMPKRSIGQSIPHPRNSNSSNSSSTSVDSFIRNDNINTNVSTLSPPGRRRAEKRWDIGETTNTAPSMAIMPADRLSPPTFRSEHDAGESRSSPQRRPRVHSAGRVDRKSAQDESIPFTPELTVKVDQSFDRYSSDSQSQSNHSSFNSSSSTVMLSAPQRRKSLDDDDADEVWKAVVAAAGGADMDDGDDEMGVEWTDRQEHRTKSMSHNSIKSGQKTSTKSKLLKEQSGKRQATTKTKKSDTLSGTTTTTTSRYDKGHQRASLLRAVEVRTPTPPPSTFLTRDSTAAGTATRGRTRNADDDVDDRSTDST